MAFNVGRATSTTTGHLFSQAFCLSVVTVSSGWACPGGVVIPSRFPAFLWVFQYLCMLCRAGVCQMYPTALGLLGFLPVCVQVRSDCMLWKGIHAQGIHAHRPAQCRHLSHAARGLPVWGWGCDTHGKQVGCSADVVDWKCDCSCYSAEVFSVG